MTGYTAAGIAIVLAIIGTLSMGLSTIFGIRAAALFAKATDKQGADIISGQQQSTASLLAAVARIERLQKTQADDLAEAFPYGYVLFGIQPNGNIIHLPFHTGKAEFVTEWNNVRITINPLTKSGLLTIPNFTYAVPGQTEVGIFNCSLVNYSFRYAVGLVTPMIAMGGSGPSRPAILFFSAQR